MLEPGSVRAALRAHHNLFLLKRVTAIYHPLDMRCRPVRSVSCLRSLGSWLSLILRLFLEQSKTKAWQSSNPSCIVEAKLMKDPTVIPRVDLVFKNDVLRSLPAVEMLTQSEYDAKNKKRTKIKKCVWLILIILTVFYLQVEGKLCY